MDAPLQRGATQGVPFSCSASNLYPGSGTRLLSVCSLSQACSSVGVSLCHVMTHTRRPIVSALLQPWPGHSVLH